MSLNDKIYYKMLGLKWLATTQIAKIFARSAGARLGRGVKFVGSPIISMAEGSSLHIKSNVVLVSDPRGTALGVRSPVIIRCLTGNARIEIGEDSGLSGTVICAAEAVIIGKRCLIGSDVLIYDTDFHNHARENRRYSEPRWPEISSPVTIGDDVFIGARAIIMKGASIGPGSIVAAASVVTGSVPPNSIVAGIPARVIRRVPSKEDGILQSGTGETN